MADGCYRFEDFALDAGDRRLRRGDAAVELNARYLDEVWRGVPVTDEALTQCIKTLRRQLGDDAANPRFIATVPKHGYRFIAPVEVDEVSAPHAAVMGSTDNRKATHHPWREFLLLGGAGTAGAGLA